MPSHLTSWISEQSPERGTIIAISLASILFYYVANTYFDWYRLRQFPGPPTAAFSNVWGFLTVAFGNCHKIIHREQEKYGKVMRIGPKTLMVSDPETIWHINSARSAYNRGGWYSSVKFHPEGDSVFSEMSTSKHDKRKAKLIAGFSGKGALNHEVDVDSRMAELINHIKAKVRSGRGDKLDLSKIIRWFQLDLITLVGLGEAWGDLADETDHYDFLKSMDMAIAFIHSISMLPILRSLVFSRPFLYLTAPRVTDKEGLGSSIR